MTRRVNFTSAKTVTHRIAMPMLKPKKISMMGIIRLRCHNHFGRQYALQNVEPATQLAVATVPSFLLHLLPQVKKVESKAVDYIAA